MDNLNITSLEELKIMAQGEVIELPPFITGKRFIVRVRKPSLLNLIRKGIIPNKLLSAAEELFYGKKASTGVDLKQLTDVMFIMAENAIVEPSVQDLNSIGLEITDDQLVALFNYTQGGLSELESFREEQQNIECNSNEQQDEGKTKQNNIPE